MVQEKEGSRMMFYQSGDHGEYLLWLHSKLFELGYCKSTAPTIRSRTFKTGKVSYFIRFESFTFTSFNWIREAFYPKTRKIVPLDIGNYLTPLALAIWLMDDGTLIKNKGIKFATNCFTLNEVKLLSTVLSEKYNLKTSIIKTGAVNQYNIYIAKSSLDTFRGIVKPYIHKTMLYKLYSL